MGRTFDTIIIGSGVAGMAIANGLVADGKKVAISMVYHKDTKHTKYFILYPSVRGTKQSSFRFCHFEGMKNFYSINKFFN